MRRFDSKSPNLKLFLYGPPGTYKTPFAYTCSELEKYRPVLWLNYAGNPESVRAFNASCDIFDVTIHDLPAITAYLRGGQKNASFAEQHGLRRDYKTVVLDQISQLQQEAFRLVAPESDLKPVLDKPEWAEYNKILRWGYSTVTGLYSCPMHVIIIAWAVRSADGYVVGLEGRTEASAVGEASVAAAALDIDSCPPAIQAATRKSDASISHLLLLRRFGTISAANKLSDAKAIPLAWNSERMNTFAALDAALFKEN